MQVSACKYKCKYLLAQIFLEKKFAPFFEIFGGDVLSVKNRNFGQ
jgi:hypothetical protein